MRESWQGQTEGKREDPGTVTAGCAPRGSLGMYNMGKCPSPKLENKAKPNQTPAWGIKGSSTLNRVCTRASLYVKSSRVLWPEHTIT